MKIIEYIVVSAITIIGLEDRINDLLPQYTPIGGIAVVSSDNGIIQKFYQAMVKYEEDKP